MKLDALIAAAETIAFDADQRLARAAIRSAIAIAPRIAECAWNVTASHGQPLWTVRLAPRRQVTADILQQVLANLAVARCSWASGWTPVTGLAACRIEIATGSCMELIFTLPGMIGQLGIVRRQHVMCLTSEPFQSDADGHLQGNVMFWTVDGTEITRVLGEWSTYARKRTLPAPP
jgi:hypothetical protein